MTAWTPAYAHAIQSLCIKGPMVNRIRFRLVTPKARHSQFPTIRTTIRLTGMDFKSWCIFCDGGTHAENGETSAWDKRNVVFAPVPPRRMHPAFAGASQDTNSTAEFSGFIEALIIMLTKDKSPEKPGCASFTTHCMQQTGAWTRLINTMQKLEPEGQR